MGLLLLILLGLPALAQEQQQGPVFRTSVNWVRVDVQAGVKNKVLSGLSQADFVVYDEGQPQKILYFGRESEPLDVLLLLDVSGSMRRYLEQMANNAQAALRQLHPGDRVAVMCFSRRSQLEEELTADLGGVEKILRDAVREQGLGSGTRINPAILDAASYLGKDQPAPGAPPSRVPRRAILILTDNESLNYQVPDDMVVRALLGADTVFNAIVVGRGERPKPPRPGVYQNPDFTPSDVFHIAEETGGEAVRAEHAGESFRDLMEGIRTRFSMQYAAPQAAAAGAFRRIRVELSPEARRRYPHAWVRARSGYVVK